MIDLLYDLATGTAKAPTKAYQHDAAYDLHADEDALVGGLSTMISTGLMMAIPPGYGGLLMGRSSVGKASVTPIGFVFEEDGLLRLGGCIDSGYRDPIKVMLARASGAPPYVVRRGDAIAQIWVLPVPETRLVHAPGRLPASERGRRGFGSSNPPAAPHGVDPERWSRFLEFSGMFKFPPTPEWFHLLEGGPAGELRGLNGQPPRVAPPGYFHPDPNRRQAPGSSEAERYRAWVASGSPGPAPVSDATQSLPTEEEARRLLRQIKAAPETVISEGEIAEHLRTRSAPDSWEQRVGTDSAPVHSIPTVWTQPAAPPLPPPTPREVGFGQRVMTDEAPAARQFSRPRPNPRERRSPGEDEEGGRSPGLPGYSLTQGGLIVPRSSVEPPRSPATGPTGLRASDPTPEAEEPPMGLLEALAEGERIRGLAAEVARVAWEEELPMEEPEDWPKLLAVRVEQLIRDRISVQSGA
jgi:dUTPase